MSFGNDGFRLMIRSSFGQLKGIRNCENNWGNDKLREELVIFLIVDFNFTLKLFLLEINIS